MKNISYKCPYCGNPSCDMLPLKKINIPTDYQKRIAPHLAYEILECTCGRKLTWFDMIVA